jgi:hypothetical protein
LPCERAGERTERDETAIWENRREIKVLEVKESENGCEGLRATENCLP